MTLHPVAVRRDLPDREIQHHLEGDLLIIRIGVDYSDDEAARAARRIRLKYAKKASLIPLLPLFPHRHATTAGLAAATIGALTVSLAVITGPSPQPSPRVDPERPAAAPAADSPQPGARRVTPDKPEPRTSPTNSSDTSAPQPSGTPVADIVGTRHPIRAVTGPHPLRSITSQHPARHLLTPAVGEHPIRRLLSPAPTLPLPLPQLRKP